MRIGSTRESKKMKMEDETKTKKRDQSEGPRNESPDEVMWRINHVIVDPQTKETLV